jgi:ubiquitin-like-conjugating enzyme ATG3
VLAVPCLRRVAAVEQYGNVDESIIEAEGDNEGWLATDTAPKDAITNADGFEEVPSTTEGLTAGPAAPFAGEEDAEEEDIPDIADLELEDAPAPAAAPITSDVSGVLKTRTYDLMISYDKHYAVPRMWLSGYDEDGTPLGQAQVREDIWQEHLDKTVTVEPFPHRSTALPVVSIHPCKHDRVMHKLSHIVAGEGKSFDVEQ